jgi:3-methyladenine DNA glycosylase Mpg
MTRLERSVFQRDPVTCARAFVAKHPPGAAHVYFDHGMHRMLNGLVNGGTADE